MKGSYKSGLHARTQGWADTSFHGSPQIPTPNLDALAADGVVLNNHYAQSVCSPSGAALLTGLYPLRFGLDGNLFFPSAPGGAPLNVNLLPKHLGKLGYKGDIVGKWHIGCSTWSHTPTNRGFDSHVGYLNHDEDNVTHTVTYNGSCGYDFWFNEQLLTDAYGVYSMDIFLRRAKTIIRDHDASEPLFLFFSMQAPHIGTGQRYFQPPEENRRKFLYIGDTNRIGYAATLDTMDQATGAVVEALYEKGMLEDAVIIFSSDNGPDPIGMGSSWPLRGSKQSLWEGGVRVPAFIWSPLLDRSGAEGRVSWDLMHMVDWMPTLYQAAGGKIDDLGPIDGVSQWGTLSRGEPPARQELLHGFDPTDGSGAYRSGRYKLVVTPSNKSWKNGRFQPAGNVSSNIDVDQLTADSAAAKTLAKLYSATETRAPGPEWRRRAALSCKEDEQGNFKPSDSLYLFDVLDDPCEKKNLASERSDLVESLMKKLNAAASIAVPPGQSSPKPEAFRAVGVADSIIFLVYCFAPIQPNGSTHIYTKFIRPVFLRNETTVNKLAADAGAGIRTALQKAASSANKNE
ncbi:arylsulfatase B-like [Amblyomma americanum]